MNKKTIWFFITILSILIVGSFAHAAPTSPLVTYVSNSSYTATPQSRSEDAKGTITVVTMDANQQNMKWKAYVGNVTGKLVLDDVNSKSIYDWSMATITGEVYVSRATSVDWTTVICANDVNITAEQTFVGMSASAIDNINKTFNYTGLDDFTVGTRTVSGCRGTATYINDAAQTVDNNAFFQEILMVDATSNFVYATAIDNDQASYDGANTYDFQLLVAENESATIPTTYFFYVDIG